MLSNTATPKYYRPMQYTDWFAHHGIKGQKWGVRRFQNPDGSLTAAGKVRYNKARYGADYTLSAANANLARYSNAEEFGSKAGQYAVLIKNPGDGSENVNDVSQYFIDAKNGALGFRNYKKIVGIKLSAIDEIKYRTGNDIIRDMYKNSKLFSADVDTKQFNKDFELLNKYKRFDKDGNIYDNRLFIQAYNNADEKTKEEIDNAIGRMIDYMNYTLGNNFENRKKVVDYYAKKGYTLIGDPEDFMRDVYKHPVILTNEKYNRASQKTIVKDSFAMVNLKKMNPFYKRLNKKEAKSMNELFGMKSIQPVKKLSYPMLKTLT